MNLKEKLDKEILQQTRNGRDSVYIEVKDLQELGIHTDKEEGRTFVDLVTLQSALKKYEFRTPRFRFYYHKWKIRMWKNYFIKLYFWTIII